MNNPSTGAVCLLLLLTGIGPVVNAAVEPSTANPFYWQVDGQPTLLLGGSDADSIFHWSAPQLTTHLDLLVANGGNYLRVAQNNREWDDSLQANRYDLVQPFHQFSPGRFDLAQWDEEYWGKLRFLLDETQRRGIIVQLELFDSDAIVQRAAWTTSAWNPNNNINYTFASTTLVNTNAGDGKRFFEVIPEIDNDAVVYAAQRRYVSRVIELTREYDHILFTIDNESNQSHTVGGHWADYVRTIRGFVGGANTYVTDSRRYRPPSYLLAEMKVASHPETAILINNPGTYNFLDLSQNTGNTGQTLYDNLLWYRNQAAAVAPRPINHTKTYAFSWPTGGAFQDRAAVADREATNKLWRNIFAGAAAVRFHRRNTRQPAPGLGLGDKAQLHLRRAREIANSIAFWEYTPQPDLLAARSNDEAYVLEAGDNRYAVFFTGAGDGMVTLAATGEFTARQLDIETGAWTTTELTAAAVGLRLDAPAGRQVVTLLKPAATKAEPIEAATIISAILPSGRSVQVGSSATAFATIINTSASQALNCGLALSSTLPADFSYRATLPETNEIDQRVGENTPVAIDGNGGQQTFVFAITPSAAFATTTVQLAFTCTNSEPAPITTGLNTLELSATDGAVPDVVALALTPDGGGLMRIRNDAEASAFAVASANLGQRATLQVSTDTGEVALPIELRLCLTNARGSCTTPTSPVPGPVEVDFASGARPTFSVFATRLGKVPFDPARNRVFVRFKDRSGEVRGSTSVAVQID